MPGVAGNNTWGAIPLEDYQIKPSSTPVNFDFTIIPINRTSDIDKHFKK